MSESLSFRQSYSYELQKIGIAVPVRLDFGGRFVELKAKVDTGASYCIFARVFGETLGLNIESGIPEEISTVMGSFQVYGHQVALSTLGISLDVTVYFAANPQFVRNVLGRQGWMDRLRIGIVDYEGKLYLSEYDDLD
jgi:hypothetical protein